MYASLRSLTLTTLLTLLFWLPSVSLRAEIITGMTIFDFTPDPSVGLNLSVNTSSNLVDIFMSGRNDGWFAVGFGRRDMDRTYAIVVDQAGMPSEYRLANFGFGNALLANNLSLISNSVNGTIRSVHLQRPRDLGSSLPDHFVFPSLPGDIDLAGASSSGAFGFHANRDGGSITLSAVPEPGSTSLVVACAVVVFGLRRRFRYSQPSKNC